MNQNKTIGWLRRGVLALGVLPLALLACGVDSPSEGTGGVGKGEGGAPGTDCPSGTVVVLSDYASTQIALSDLEGKTQSEAFLSTASAKTDGLAFALSGDVTLPGTAPTSGQVVVLDRFGTNVVTWADPVSGEVIAQLPVGTGFESNPQDYLELSQSLAVVSRWGQNGDPGSENYDEGGDLILIDLEKHAIVGNLVMPTADELPARPSALGLVEEDVIVTLDRIALDFSETGEATLVGVDQTGKHVVWEETLEGRKACGRATLSPDGSRFVVVCTGALDPTGKTESLSQSAVLLFDAKERPLQLLESFEAEDLLGVPLQADIAFVSDELVLLKTQTPWGGEGNNQLFSLDLTSGETEELLEASADAEGKGKGIVYGGTFCAPGCSEHCLMADADQGVVQRIRLEPDGKLSIASPIVVEDSVGLPPLAIAPR